MRRLSVVIAGFLLSALPLAAEENKPPNIVILYADDLGYGDLSCYGHPTIHTPNIDKMAAEGIRFTQFYSASPVCSPSRAALLTGRLPIRTGINRVLNPKSTGGIQADEITIADALRKKGYATICIGKWHLGHLEQYRPLRHGFDHHYGLFYSNDMTPVGLYRDDTEIENPIHLATLTERYTAEALRFLKEHESGTKPFFLYLPYTMPHVPLAASPKFSGHSKRGLYGDVVETIDWSVGEILKRLRDSKLAENTFVFFSSDNGPWLSRGLDGGSAGLLREGKGSTWEGGVREPGIAWWPGKIKPGQVTSELAATMDLFPTCLRFAGAEIPNDRPIDGKSLLPILFGTGQGERHINYYYIDQELTAIRKGAWKAHFITQIEFGDKSRREHDPALLFNLEEDPSEKHDVAAEFPAIVTDLANEAEKHKREVKPGKPQT
ncbi:MAG TPA: sulfatase [Gemmataceae bacterium]|jgi:arylsulfatase A|nr:sulfatase [Gemmataceae bacterium]